MTDPSSDRFMQNAKGFTKSPLGIIALFISLIYALACLLLGFSLNNLHTTWERLPLIWFVIIFPILILIAFLYLVIFHPDKIYGPTDFRDDKSFLKVFIGNKKFKSDLSNITEMVRGLATADNEEKIKTTVEEIEKIKERTEQVPINYLWDLNHWGSNYAIIQDNKMIFAGFSALKDEDGSNISLNELLEIGKSYEVSCFVKSTLGTTGKIRLWCHDQTESGNSKSTQFKVPSSNGEKIGLIFQAKFNRDIRIHLQYTPGEGQIEVSDVKITERQ